jgi:phosphatidylglycerol:prolipoprotein diacylglycerol transferase
MMGIGWGIGFQISNKLKPNIISSKTLYFIFISLFFTAWLGSKFFYLLSSDFKYFYSANFWLGGGYVFYGGLVFALMNLFLLSKLFKLNISTFDFMIPGLCFGHAIGRIGCFIAGCCYGINYIPVQLIESFFLFILGFKLYKNKNSNLPILTKYLVAYSIFRFMIEFLRGDADRGIVFGLSTSQWISLMILCLIMISKLLKLQIKKI